MRVDVEYERCEGHGMCVEQAPAVFQLDDDGNLEYRFDGADLPAEYAEPVELAASVCPVAALRVVS